MANYILKTNLLVILFLVQQFSVWAFPKEKSMPLEFESDPHIHKTILESKIAPLENLEKKVNKTTKAVLEDEDIKNNIEILSKELVTSVVTKLTAQDKLTKLIISSLESSARENKITAIETRRILEHFSRTISSQILASTTKTADPMLHRLVFGLAQTAAEISVLAALRDNTLLKTMSSNPIFNYSNRKKRSVNATVSASIGKDFFVNNDTAPFLTTVKNETSVHIDLTDVKTTFKPNVKTNIEVNSTFYNMSPYSFIKNAKENKESRAFIENPVTQSFTNLENQARNENETIDSIGDELVLENTINDMNIVDIKQADINPDVIFNVDQIGQDELDKPEIQVRHHLDHLENKAKKAIAFAAEVAYLTAYSVVSTRKALTASIESEMAIKYTLNGVSDHKMLMLRLAKTAAQQAGKQARIASSKSLLCDRALKQALKYTISSEGSKLNILVNRVIMEAISLASISKSMSYVASNIALTSMYNANDLKSY